MITYHHNHKTIAAICEDNDVVTQPQPKGKITSARITRREDLTEDLWKVWLLPEQPFRFKPGQYCTIGSEGIERAYSIASAPDDEELELFIETILPDVGSLTPILAKMRIGDTVTLRPRAKGIFLFKSEFKTHVMVGTVTGVAPYVSMLRSLATSKTTPFERYNLHLLEGASYMDQFGYDDDFRRIHDKYPNFSMLLSVSRPSEKRNRSWEGASGRINTLVEDYLSRNELKPEETVVYACGHPQMIEDVRKRLAGSGFHFEEERFWKD